MVLPKLTKDPIGFLIAAVTVLAERGKRIQDFSTTNSHRKVGSGTGLLCEFLGINPDFAVALFRGRSARPYAVHSFEVIENK